MLSIYFASSCSPSLLLPVLLLGRNSSYFLRFPNLGPHALHSSRSPCSLLFVSACCLPFPPAPLLQAGSIVTQEWRAGFCIAHLEPGGLIQRSAMNSRSLNSTRCTVCTVCTMCTDYTLFCAQQYYRHVCTGTAGSWVGTS